MSGKEIFCFFHIGGKIVKNIDGNDRYEGGRKIGRMITQGMSRKQLMETISSCTLVEVDGAKIYYSVKFDPNVYLDLFDDEGVDQLIKFNDESCHVYIVFPGNGTCDRRESSSLGSFGTLPDSSSRNASTKITVEQLGTTGDAQHLPCAVESVPAPTPLWTGGKWKDELLGQGQIFKNAADFKLALYKFSIAHNFAYNYTVNSSRKMIATCRVENCSWKITAYGVGEASTFLRVTTFNRNHTHSAQESLDVGHKVRSNLTSELIIDEMRSHPDKAPQEIRRDLYREYGLAVTYRQAWKGKETALSKIHGRAEESYMLIPWLCERLMAADNETVAKWVSLGNNFQSLFIAYGCCIEGFLLGCRPLLSIDACHLSGPYRGTLLSASAYDANNDMYPLAYAIVSGETTADWTWFMQNLKEIVGSVQVTIVSDRHNAIIHAVRAIFGSDRHAYCYRHIKENFSTQYGKIFGGKGRARGRSKEDALKVLDAIAYARVECDFDRAMANMRAFSAELARWLDKDGDIDKWAMSRFIPRRWDIMTTNLAESFNAWIAKERKHNVAALVHEHRDKLAQKLFATKGAMSQWSNGVSPKIEKKLKDNVIRGGRMQAMQYSESRILVRAGPTDVHVNITLRECTCRAWQMSGIPCAHACAAIKVVNDNIYSFVEECYLVCSQERIYNRTMVPVENHDIPDLNSGNLDPDMTQTLLTPPTTWQTMHISEGVPIPRYKGVQMFTVPRTRAYSKNVQESKPFSNITFFQYTIGE